MSRPLLAIVTFSLGFGAVQCTTCAARRACPEASAPPADAGAIAPLMALQADGGLGPIVLTPYDQMLANSVAGIGLHPSSDGNWVTTDEGGVAYIGPLRPEHLVDELGLDDRSSWRALLDLKSPPVDVRNPFVFCSQRTTDDGASECECMVGALTYWGRGTCRADGGLR